MGWLPDEARRIVDRLAAIDWANPVLDRERVEYELARHLRAQRREPRPVHWMPDAEEGHEIARGADPPCLDEWRQGQWWWAHDFEKALEVWSAVRDAARVPVALRSWLVAAYVAGTSVPAVRESAWHLASTPEQWIELAVFAAAGGLHGGPAQARRAQRIGLATLDAYEAGLWLFWVTPEEVIAVPRPALRIEDDRLHCEDGPAVSWPEGVGHYFWHGVEVPEKVILAPDSLTATEIADEPNVEVRRVMIERFGAERYLNEAGATMVQADRCGTLWRAEFGDDEPLQMVEVVNATAEPDGSRRSYWLRVPPDLETARDAVAWTFDTSDYDPAAES